MSSFVTKKSNLVYFSVGVVFVGCSLLHFLKSFLIFSSLVFFPFPLFIFFFLNFLYLYLPRCTKNYPSYLFSLSLTHSFLVSFSPFAPLTLLTFFSLPSSSSLPSCYFLLCSCLCYSSIYLPSHYISFYICVFSPCIVLLLFLIVVLFSSSTSFSLSTSFPPNLLS